MPPCCSTSSRPNPWTSEDGDGRRHGLAKDIAATGRVSLYGLYFDFRQGRAQARMLHPRSVRSPNCSGPARPGLHRRPHRTMLRWLRLQCRPLAASREIGGRPPGFNNTASRPTATKARRGRPDRPGGQQRRRRGPRQEPPGRDRQGIAASRMPGPMASPGPKCQGRRRSGGSDEWRGRAIGARRAGTQFKCEKQSAHGRNGMVVTNHPGWRRPPAWRCWPRRQRHRRRVHLPVRPDRGRADDGPDLIGGTTSHIRLADGSTPSSTA